MSSKQTRGQGKNQASGVDWYLARDGQQHGPLTEAEMQKFHELGHLRRTDLVWRKGFKDWRPATAVFSFEEMPVHYRKEWSR